MTAETDRILAWSKQYSAWNEKYKAFVKKHPKPDVSYAAEYDAFMKKHPKPPISKALVAWHEEINDFYIRHPFPNRHISSPPTKPHSKAKVPHHSLQPTPIAKIDLDNKSLIPSQMLSQTKTKALSLLEMGNQSLVPHTPKPEPVVAFDLYTESLVSHSHCQALVLQEQWDALNQCRALSILDSNDQLLVPYMPQPEPLSIFDMDSQSLIPHSNCKLAAVLHTQGDALNQEFKDAKSKDLDLIDFHRKKTKKGASEARVKVPEALPSNNMEKMDDWNTKYNAWNEKYNAFKKSHPKPPRSKEEVSWERAYQAFVKKRTSKPGISKKLAAWNKKIRAFYKKNPIPILSTRPLKLQSNALKRKSEALIPNMTQPKPITKFNLDSQSQITPQILPHTKTKTLSVPDSCNQSLVRHMPKPKSLEVVDLDRQSLFPHMQPQSETKTLSGLDSSNQSLVSHTQKPKPLAVVDLDSHSLIIPHMQPQSKTKTLSGLDSSNQSRVPQMPKPKPHAVLDLDSESLVPHVHPQYKTKPLPGIDSPNKSQVPHIPKPKPPAVVDLDSESFVPHVHPQSKTIPLSGRDSTNKSQVPHMPKLKPPAVVDLDSQSFIPYMQPQAKTKTLSELGSSNQSQVTHMPKPKPFTVVDLDSQSLIPHMQPQSKNKTLLRLDSSNQSLVSHMPNPEPLAVVDLDSQSLVPHMQPQTKTKTLSLLDSGNQSLVPHVLLPESLVVLDLDNQSLIPHANSKAAVLHNQGDNLNKGDKTGNQKYLAGNTSEVLLLGNSGDTVLSTYMDIDEEKINGSSLGSINSLAIAQTNPDLVSINHHRKKMKKSASGAYSIVPYAQMSINLDDDDVYDIPRPLAHKGAKGKKLMDKNKIRLEAEEI